MSHPNRLRGSYLFTFLDLNITKMGISRQILCLGYLLYCVHISAGYFITVDADAEECFFDKVAEKAKMGKSTKFCFKSLLIAIQ